MSEYLYMTLNVGSISIPLAYSIFEQKFHFIQYLKIVLLSLVCMAIPFLIWDAIFTYYGVWGFNPAYHLSVKLAGMPMEEWLFFFCIPYACLFSHEALKYYIPGWGIPKKFSLWITRLLQFGALIIIICNYDKLYTFMSFTTFLLVISIGQKRQPDALARYYPTFMIILLPFMIVNGILTGSLIENQVVWYNDLENLGIRMGTIPVEDIFYAFTLLFGIQMIYNQLKGKFHNALTRK